MPIVELRGKSVLQRGASTGLGPHIARRLRREGATLVLSPRKVEALGTLAGELGGARVMVADLSRPGEPERLAAEAALLMSSSPTPACRRAGTWRRSASRRSTGRSP